MFTKQYNGKTILFKNEFIIMIYDLINVENAVTFYNGEFEYITIIFRKMMERYSVNLCMQFYDNKYYRIIITKNSEKYNYENFILENNKFYLDHKIYDINFKEITFNSFFNKKRLMPAEIKMIF